jgi:aminoglycoside 3-N-acetyltransferase
MPKGIRRAVRGYVNKLTNRTGERALVRCFAALGIPAGSPICVHSALSGFGYIAGGADTVIRAIGKAVPDCTLMMPSFPFTASMEEYVNTNPVFDPATTPSRSGALTEALRLTPGSLRSRHPTHSCSALGPLAAELLRGTECAKTPFGDDSTYGRYALRPDAVLLLLDTNNTSIVHRFQEVVDMPNLFLPGERSVRGYDAQGRLVEYSVRVHRPLLPLFVFTGGEYVWFPDYAVPFPSSRQAAALARLKSPAVRRFILERNQQFFDEGVFRRATHRSAEVLAIALPKWQQRICADVRKTIEEFAPHYTLEAVARAHREGLLVH